MYDLGGKLIAEYNGPTSTSNAGTSYLTTDHLGSTRVVTNSSGVIARHDYLPFGTEIQANFGGRTVGQGYSNTTDDTRQKFTSKERDSDSNLDFFEARYYSSAQGRFTSPDEFKGGAHDYWVSEDEYKEETEKAKQSLPYADVTNPQTLNKYQYALNNPLRFIDPDGHEGEDAVIKVAVEYLAGGGAVLTIEVIGGAIAGAGEGVAVVSGTAMMAAAAYDLITTGQPGSRANSSRYAERAPHEMTADNASRSLPLGVHLTRQQDAIKKAASLIVDALIHVSNIQNGKPDCPPGSQCHEDNIEHWKTEIKARIKSLRTQLKRLKGQAKTEVEESIQFLEEFVRNNSLR